ncbi:MAG: nucleotidyltransferase domain-containing protein [archaeon]
MLLDKSSVIIIDELLRQSTTATAIARKHRLNQKTVANRINEMEKEHVAKSTMNGKNKEFQMTSFHLVAAAEHLKTQLFLDKHTELAFLFDQEGIIVIFGSYAKGTQKPNSDIDVMIVGKTKPKYDLLHITRLTPEEFRKNSAYVLKEVKDHHVILAGVEEYLKVTYAQLLPGQNGTERYQ